jgi:hypothetical protein
MANSARRYWIGVGMKIEGFLGIAGGNTFTAIVLGVSKDNHFLKYVQVDGMTVGIGLGGSIGTSVFVSNVNVLDGEDGAIQYLTLPIGFRRKLPCQVDISKVEFSCFASRC